jgi:hypothetical protein
MQMRKINRTTRIWEILNPARRVDKQLRIRKKANIIKTTKW